MHLYGSTVAEAAHDVAQDEFITACVRRFTRLYGDEPSPEEAASWRNSWPALLSVLSAAGLDRLHVLLEYPLPGTGERIDVLLLGQASDGRLATVAFELKQWTEARTFPGAPWLVQLNGHFLKHPSRQIGGYVSYLQDWVSRDNQELDIRGVVVLHNASAHVITELRTVLRDGASSRFPVLGRDDLDTDRHAADLARAMTCADLQPAEPERIARFLATKHRPSPSLLARAGAVIESRDEFRLIGDQDLARLHVLTAVTTAQQHGSRGLVLVTGGPGTGKTAIACRLLGELCTQPDTDPRLLSPSGALTRQLQRTVGDRFRGLITTFAGRIPPTVNSGSVVLLDEAHRTRTNRHYNHSGRFPTILGKLLELASVAVLFLDEQQIIRPDEGITVQELETYAANNDLRFTHIDLTSQFRCNGSRAYLHWIDQLLAPHGPAPVWEGNDYDLALATNPDHLSTWIHSHAAAGATARIAAGFCWPWQESRVPPLPNEVSITWTGPTGQHTWERPWNFTENDTLPTDPDVPARPYWSTDPGGENQVGCIYTAQGMEYGYSAVIIGNDLVRRHGRWHANPEASHDRKLRPLPPDHYLPYALNTYRVLATRGTNGTRLYSTDPTTQEYLRTLLPHRI